MIQPLRKIGNSSGIILSKTLLQQAGIEDAVEVEVVDNSIVLRPMQKIPRKGWEEAFDRALEAGDQPESDLFDSIPNEFDQTEW